MKNINFITKTGWLNHCFGKSPSDVLTPAIATSMLKESAMSWIPLNTHNIGQVASVDDLLLGYGDVTVRMVKKILNIASYHLVLNINQPTSASEAISRSQLAIEWTGLRTLKIEVLNSDLLTANNEEITLAISELRKVRPILELWPLITPDFETFMNMQELGCPTIRVQGSPIGSFKGISFEANEAIIRILRHKKCAVMLDGGIGSIEHVRKALQLGFDSVLINSYLFRPGSNPATQLKAIRQAIEQPQMRTVS